MSEFEVLTPAQDSPVVRDDDGVIFFGQQLELLKGILVCDIDTFDTLILIDVKEKDGSMLNNREFPIYFFALSLTVSRRGSDLIWMVNNPILARHSDCFPLHSSGQIKRNWMIGEPKKR